MESTWQVKDGSVHLQTIGLIPTARAGRNSSIALVIYRANK